MSGRPVVLGALAVVALIASSTLARAQTLPPPPQYDPAKAGVDPLEHLRDAKVTWLNEKLAREKSHLKALKDNPRPNVDEKIATTEKAIDQTQSEINGLKEKDALKPDKNGDAAKHAKLIEKNVLAWIDTLADDAKKADAAFKEAKTAAEAKKAKPADAEKAEQAKKKHQALVDRAKALKDDLEKAKKAAPRLFE